MRLRIIFVCPYMSYVPTGKEFAIKFCPRSAAQYGGGKESGAGSETGSVYSDSGDSKTTTLMADDAEVICDIESSVYSRSLPQTSGSCRLGCCG
jgi:hypothetical protein